MKKIIEGGIELTSNDDKILIKLGDICLMKKDNKNESYCNQNEDNFDYCRINNALSLNYNFIPKRLIVIQMK